MKAEERWKARGWGLSFGENRQRERIAEYDVSGKQLEILPQSSHLSPYGEEHHRRRERVGLDFQGGLRGIGVSFSA